MSSIRLENVSVDFPIYNARGRSIRNTFLRRVGGQIDQSGDIVTISALRGIDLHLKPGDRLALVGHNGAGKSTLLRVLSRAYEPTHGTAVIQGAISSLLDPTMGMDPELTGRENIALRGVFLGLTFAQANALIPEVAEFSELGPYLDLPMRTYSAGMTLRLAFGVSTAVQPDIILLDEMISVGDASFAKKARARVENMMSQAKILVFASHDPKSLADYCNRAIWLREGRIAAQGSVTDVLEQAGLAPLPMPAVQLSAVQRPDGIMAYGELAS